MYQRRKARILLVVLVLVAFVLVTVDFRSGDDEGSDGPLDRLRGAVTAVVRPIQDGVATVVRPVADSLGGVTDVFSVRSENERLRAQIETLQVRERSTVDLERENAELRQLLELRERAELEAVTASVVALGASQFEWTITLNVGSDDGVARNMPVINGDGLVGRVLDTTGRASTVLLTIDPNFSVTVRGSDDGEIGLLAGRGGEPLAFSPLDPEIEFVENQELVTTSYDGGLYPAGIPVGTIAEAGESTTALAREIAVRPFVDFTRLHEVLVIVNAPTEPLPPFEDSEALDFVRPDVETFVDPDEAEVPDPADDAEAEVEGEGSGPEDGGT
jgi:rod shape-determining protein MreC